MSSKPSGAPRTNGVTNATGSSLIPAVCGTGSSGTTRPSALSTSASRNTRLAPGSDHANFTMNEPSTIAVLDDHSGFEVSISGGSSIRAFARRGAAAATAWRTDDSEGSGNQRIRPEVCRGFLGRHVGTGDNEWS